MSTAATANASPADSPYAPPKPIKSLKPPAGPSEASAAKAKAKDAKKEKRAAALATRAAGAPATALVEVDPSSIASTSQQGGPSTGGTSTKVTPSTTGPARKGAAIIPGFAAPPPVVATPGQRPQDLLFAHLPTSHSPDSYTALSGGKIHPIIIRLGLLLSSGDLRGANARVIGILSAFKEVIGGFSCPPEELHRLLPAHISPMIAFLDQCRPKGVGGGNAIRWLKSEINRVGTDKCIRTESEQRAHIIDAIDDYLRDRIDLADEVICSFAVEKIKSGDTIVTYARSSLVEKVLLDAWKQLQADDPSQTFTVMVVDAGPLFEGRDLLHVLESAGMTTSYCLLPSLPTVLHKASLVLLGTAALLSDGAMYSRAGTAMVAMLAKEMRIPVVACCETYKFGEKVVLDAVTGNEKGDSVLLAKRSTEKIALEETQSSLTQVNLLYDLTPASYITAVCTELGFIPPSSVPTVIVKGEAEPL